MSEQAEEEWEYLRRHRPLVFTGKVLTNEEFLTATTGIASRSIDHKLIKYQKSITDKSHIEKINCFIPDAILYADQEVAKRVAANEYPNALCRENDRDFLYLAEMNRLTKAAGLRC